MKINDNNEEYSGQPKVMQKNVDSKEAAVGAGEGVVTLESDEKVKRFNWAGFVKHISRDFSSGTLSTDHAWSSTNSQHRTNRLDVLYGQE